MRKQAFGQILLIAACVVSLQACAATDGLSFTTQASSAKSRTNDPLDDRRGGGPTAYSGALGAGLLAASGNALLPGGVILASGRGGQALAGLDLTLAASPDSLPQVGVSTTGALAGSPLVGPLGQIASASPLSTVGSSITSAPANVAKTGMAATEPVSAVVQTAGTPLTGIGGGAVSLLSATPAAVTPNTAMALVVNPIGTTASVAGAVTGVASMPVASAPAAVTNGLGLLNPLVPRLR